MLLSDLSGDELARYARQIGPGALSAQGQTRLKHAAALVSRAGGMGGPAALALVMAGIGRLVFAHGGNLDSPDLNRQVLGSEEGLGKPRVVCFSETLRAMNRFVEIEAIDHEPDDDEALALARRVQVVLSCAPTFAERLRLNRAAVEAGVPLIDAAQWGMTGTLIVVDPGRTACLQCLYPVVPEFEEMFPVVGAISMAVGSLAALEAIKILAGSGTPNFGRLLLIDGFQGRWSQIELRRDPDCRCCGARKPRQ
ncbi:MAG: HesA/MoeB/ThiF family protein [Thermoguttaceae bacterium]|jgi:adhesin HecA-like repeat protein|nr:HesA/MoeB/ThiF family protein [Thermoguttaceae bacterium]